MGETRAALGGLLLLLALPLDLARAEPPAWTVEEGSIVFEVMQSGEPVEGTFERFTTDIRFDPAELASARLSVEVEVASLATGSRDRDTAATGAGLLDAARFPRARFEAEGFRDLGEGRYEAPGRLTLRDVTREVVLPFRLIPLEEGLVQAEGELTLDRFDYGIGQGDWTSTAIVGAEVGLRFSLIARRGG